MSINHMLVSRFTKNTWGILGIASLVLLVGVPFVFAQWEEPLQLPPPSSTYNKPAPINVGPDAQTKNGFLTVKSLCLKDSTNCRDTWPTGGLATMPSLQDVTTKGSSTDKTLQLTNGVQGQQTLGKWSLLGNTASTDGPFIEFWGTSNADANRRGELTLGGSSGTGRIKFYNYNGSWQPPLMTITPSGNVGIGTGNADPQKKLDVVGDMRLTGTLTEGTVPWARLGSFPTACKTGEYVESVGGTLTCKALPAAAALPSGTNDQTLRNNNGTWVSNGNFLVDQAGKLIQGSVPWMRLTEFPTCGSGFATGIYTDTGKFECGDPLQLRGSGTGGNITKFIDSGTLGDSRIIENLDAGKEAVYIGGTLGAPGSAPLTDLSVSRNLIVYGTMIKGIVPWARLSTFPTACPAGQYASGVGSALTCSTPSGSGGASLPAGTTGQTLRHDGTSWVANGALVNTGTSVGINTANPTSAKLVISDGVGSTSGAGGIAIAVNGNGNNQIIRGVAAPIKETDAANKEYVDAKVAAQPSGGGGSIVTYTSYGAGTDPARGANAPTCDKAGPGWTELFAGWGPLTGEASYSDLFGGSGGSNSGQGLRSLIVDPFGPRGTAAAGGLKGLIQGIGTMLSAEWFGHESSMPVAQTIGSIPIMQSCIDLPVENTKPKGLGIYLGNQKEYLPGNAGDDRTNYAIGALVPSGLLGNTIIYNSCRICYKKIP